MSTWKEWAGRDSGRAGYRFGDLTRHLFAGRRSARSSAEAASAERPEGPEADSTPASVGEGKSVWAVSQLGWPCFRQGCTPREPMGTAWLRIPCGDTLSAMSTGLLGQVWAATATTRQVLVRTGVTRLNAVGDGWARVGVYDKRIVDLCVGVWTVWAVAEDGSTYFREGISADHPTGSGWRLLDGRAKRVAVGANEAAVFGIDAQGRLVRREGCGSQQPAAGTGWQAVPVPASWAAVGDLQFEQVAVEEDFIVLTTDDAHAYILLLPREEEGSGQPHQHGHHHHTGPPVGWRLGWNATSVGRDVTGNVWLITETGAAAFFRASFQQHPDLHAQYAWLAPEHMQILSEASAYVDIEPGPDATLRLPEALRVQGCAATESGGDGQVAEALPTARPRTTVSSQQGSSAPSKYPDLNGIPIRVVTPATDFRVTAGMVDLMQDLNLLPVEELAYPFRVENTVLASGD